MIGTETATDEELLARVANYLFLQMCIATCDHMILHDWYADGWRLTEDLLDAEKLKCQRSNT